MQKKILTALFRKNSQAGFALIAAIMACLILLALGMLVISLSTQDIRVSTKIVGEKRALAAADTGVNSLSQTFNPFNPILAPRTCNTADRVCSSTTVCPAISCYTINYPFTTSTISPPTIPEGGGVRIIRNIDVVGINTEYNTQVTIHAVVGYGPVPVSGGQPVGPTY